MNKIMHILTIILLIVLLPYILYSSCEEELIDSTEKKYLEGIHSIVEPNPKTDSMLIGEILPAANISFYGDKTNDPLMEFYHNGQIFYKGRLITTDKEIIEGLKDIIQHFRCTDCKKRILPIKETP